MNIQFGWRVPDFPVDRSSSKEFNNQLLHYMDVIQGHLPTAWVADHFFPWLDRQDQATATFEALTTLTYFLGRYPQMRLGSIVLCQSYRNPALLAKMAATLQTLSEGRFILGLGAGWKENEYLAYGYAYPSAVTRLEQLEEAVQIIRRMWTEPAATFHGKHYHIENAYCAPKPDPIPPLMIGGGGKKITLRLVAQYADWWNVPNCDPNEYRDLLAILKSHCQRLGRNYDNILKTWSTECVAVAADPSAAERIAKASPFYDSKGAIVGTPEQVATQIQRFVDLGVRHFMFRFADFPRTQGVEFFIKELLPRFAA